MSHTPSSLTAVRVWDLPTRAFHWVLALTIVGSVVSAQIGGGAMVWHFRFGYLVFTLLAFRALWGLIGGRWSRFASFIYAPGTVLRYLRGESRADEHHEVGHSPLGSLSVFALLGFLALQVATGLVADDDIANVGPLNRFVSGGVANQATHWHIDFGKWILLALVALHVATVLYYLWRRGRNLVRPMIVGDKALPAGTPPAADSAATRLLALAVAALCAAGVGWVVNLGG
ncbi:MAG TPA: cytochrome b/b6 domain-containing protein [Rubrivivax sp.]|nr:cytochrome b/b6 domain-containing protein [Rubrivivax sp.]